MATAGSSINAFICYLDRDDALFEKQIVSSNSRCFNLDYALTELRNRKMVVVAEANMERFRMLVAEKETA